ncbi:hypothetical protein [Herbiconiux liangxiaofengii]|uniref:hypothetical protein n=1 Tax=Herbiconiux liangxiaofengii TaxID=3342795 RepID=UPI0035BAD6FB
MREAASGWVGCGRDGWAGSGSASEVLGRERGWVASGTTASGTAASGTGASGATGGPS